MTGIFNKDDPLMTGHCVHQLFEQAADRHPDSIAVICGEAEYSFAWLNAAANRLALDLAKRCIGRGDLVGVAVERSVDLVTALLAVLKTGAAYVPMDTRMPVHRIAQIMDDAGARLVVTSSATSEDDVLWPWREVCLRMKKQDDDDADDNDDMRNLGVDVGPEDLAYVMYTSGTTGVPKGVEVSHGAVSNFLYSMRREPGFDESDRILAVTTVCFNLSVLELFLPLVCGTAMVVAQAHEVRDGGALCGLMERHAVNMVQATPSGWQQLLESGWRGKPRLRKMLSGGEALTRQLADRLLDCGDALWNMYGPTEATVHSSAWRVPRGADDVLIGHAIANTQLYVLDGDLAPVPAGAVGELYIGGAGLARGFHGKAGLTRERFVDSPFGGGRLYRTGDLARTAASGEVRLLGRVDHQVKIRGHRVELGEVESALAEHGGLSRAVAVARDGRLVAYCVRRTRGGAAETRDGEARGVAEWTAAWDHEYEADEQQLAGWRSSFDGQPFSAGAMREWQLASVRRILDLSPRRVVEVGAGSGLIMAHVAPHCDFYLATDASREAVAVARRRAAALRHVVCEHRRADELSAAVAAHHDLFDTVVVNSVAQYFPSAAYLLAVLEHAVAAVGTGRVFVGDVRSRPLLHVFHAHVAHCRAGGRLSPPELARRAARRAADERELVLDPRFFQSLPSLMPRITAVDLVLRRGCHLNEMTCYRFDVTLHVGPPRVPSRAVELPWHGLSALPGQLAVAAECVLRLDGVPNGRLRHAHACLQPADAALPWVDPQALEDAASACGRSLALLPSRSDDVWRFDAVLWRPGDAPDLSPGPVQPMDRDALAAYANVPVLSEPTLDALLRPWLEHRLPAYMVPSLFVQVDEIPLTTSGKVDRKALPDLPFEPPSNAAKPATDLQRQILAIWSHVLGHGAFGIDQNFFHVGGDSLRLVRVQKELERLLGRPVRSSILFEHYTIRALALHLAGGSTTASRPRPVPARHPIPDDGDIAVIAMACRFPGGVTSPQEFWRLLESGDDATTDVPKDRWDADALYDTDPDAAGRSYCRRGGFIAGHLVDSFDAPLFSISPRESRGLDPEHSMMLETCWEGFERAGYTRDQLRGSQTGVFIGISSMPSHRGCSQAVGGLAHLDGYSGIGSAGGTLSGRISYSLGLEGPAMTVDAACASSLVTTHLACTALRRGECDMALSGGVSLLNIRSSLVSFSLRLRQGYALSILKFIKKLKAISLVTY